jgi:hypothetical protein
LATRSAAAKVSKKIKKAKNKLRLAMIKKSTKLDIKGAKAKGKARLKSAKKAARR